MFPCEPQHLASGYAFQYSRVGCNDGALTVHNKKVAARKFRYNATPMVQYIRGPRPFDLGEEVNTADIVDRFDLRKIADVLGGYEFYSFPEVAFRNRVDGFIHRIEAGFARKIAVG